MVNRLMRRFKNTKSEAAKRWYSQFLANTPCTTCGGDRLRAESSAVRVANETIVDISSWTIDRTHEFFNNLNLPGAAGEIAAEVVKEICNRLNFLVSVGLGYLSLDRPGPTLSGGESQRIRLASQVGSELSGVIYILDEPSIGLHQRDNEKLLSTLCRMRDIATPSWLSSTTKKPFDWRTMLWIWTSAGVQGGNIVHAGSPASLNKNKQSLTGNYLSGRTQIEMLEERRTSQAKCSSKVRKPITYKTSLWVSRLGY